MDELYDPDFDFLLEELSRAETSSEEVTLSSCSSDSLSVSGGFSTKKQKTSDITDFTDESSIESDLPLVKPGILRSDIRRSYAAMLLNVFNALDLPMMYGFFDTFSIPTMENTFSRPDCFRPEGGRLTLKQSGFLDTIKFWWTSFACKSDAIVSMKECRIVSPTNSNASHIVITFNFKATILYDENTISKEMVCFEHSNSLFLDASQITIGEAQKLVGNKRGKRNEAAEKAKTMRSIMSTVDSMVSRLSLRSDPLHIDTDGVITLNLDEHKRITQLFFNCKPGVNKCQ